MDKFLLELRSAAEFVDMHTRLQHIEGYLSPLEGFALMKLAEDGAGVGEIVEIGSFLGKSTCWLAAGSKKAHREKVTAIDHFEGSPQVKQMQEHECETLVNEGTTFNKFISNIESVMLSDYITPIRAPSNKAVKGWSKAIRLLFIDGDHSYQSAKEDFLNWYPFVCHGGVVCFHDIGGPWEGCTKFYRDLISTSKAVKEIAGVDSMKVIQKIL